MGMDLLGKGGYFCWNIHGWRQVFCLGLQYGWNPAGTEPSDVYPLANTITCDGDYFSNEFQWVTDEDALALADALEKSLEDMGDSHSFSESSDDGPVLPEWCEDAFRRKISSFIRYCRLGGFYIG